jgi:N(2)-fixation sustaining protein CowN
MGAPEQTDRYVTFNGIDCEGRTVVVMQAIERHAAASASPFWAYFETQRRLAHGRGLDDLRVLHNFLPTLKELLEDGDDDQTLALLEDLEVTCM